MNVIVTGANGFVGSAVCNQLLDEGYDVYAVLRNESSDITRLSVSDSLHFLYCDMDHYRELPEKLAGREYKVLYHFAWTGSAGPLRGDENVQLDNIRNSCDLIRSCEKLNCHRFVFASSIMEYEINAAMAADGKIGINTIYSTAKMTADYMLRAIAGSLGIDYIRGVISNIYGPGEKSPRLINTSLRKLLTGEHCAFSAGEQFYDFIYISDAAKEFTAIGRKGINNHTYYIGSLNPKPLKEFLCEMRDQVDPNIEIGLGEIPFNGISLSYKEFDIEAVKNDTGYEPETTFAEGIQKTVDWIRKDIMNSNTSVRKSGDCPKTRT